MIFLTVGTSFPFDRLVRAVDDAVAWGKIDADIYAQVGVGGYRPKNFQSVETLEKNKFNECFEKAKAVISHAGMGTIIMALEQRKPILVMPRLVKYRELVSEHQLVTAKRFEKLGHVISVYEINELPEKINLLKSFQPTPRESQVDKVSERIGTLLHRCIKENEMKSIRSQYVE